MKELEEKYLDVLDRNLWAVIGYTDDGRVEIERYSPAGEDFTIRAEVENFTTDVVEYANGFDPDEHISMWIEAKRNGITGVPSARELVHDADEINEMLKELAAALEELDMQPAQEKSLRGVRKMANKYKEFIQETLSRRDLLEQLAEECAEAGKAALKLIRAEKLSGNPTPVTPEQALADLEEELLDIMACCDSLNMMPEYNEEENPKWERWYRRVMESHGPF